MVADLREMTLKTGRQSRIALEDPDAPGVLPALGANLELPDFSYSLKSMFEKTPIKRKGATYISGTQTGVEDTEVTGNGAFGFVTVNYHFESLSGHVEPTEIGTGTGAWKRIYRRGGRRPGTFVVDFGDPLAAIERALNCFLAAVALDSGMKETNITTSGRGKAIAYLESDGETPVGADEGDVQRVQQIPANAVKKGTYLADALDDLGDAGATIPDPLDRVKGVRFGIGGYYETITEQKPDTTSWADAQESDASTGDVTLIVGNTIVTRGYLSYIRNDQKFFLRHEILGPVVYAGVKQVETATAAGTATASGNITVTVTAAGMTGSPVAVVVAIASGDTPTVWAGKVRTALAANANIAAHFTVGGVTTAIVLTRKVEAANDATMNIAIVDTGTTGITPVVNSTDSTAGAAPIYNRFTVTCCVMFKEGFNPGEQAPLRTLEFPLMLAEDDEGVLDGWEVETVCGVADLNDPLALIP